VSVIIDIKSHQFSPPAALDEPMTPTDDLDNQPTPDEQKESPRTICARDLFGEAREIWIDHDGERYILRITRRGKLILQK
jgi:hemin uptake protein HemP